MINKNSLSSNSMMHQSQSDGNQKSIWQGMKTSPPPPSSSTIEKVKKLVVKTNNNNVNEETWLFTTKPIRFHYPLSYQFDNNDDSTNAPRNLNKNKDKMDTLPRTFSEMAKDLHDDQHGIGHKINYKHYAIMTVLFTILVLSSKVFNFRKFYITSLIYSLYKVIWLLAHDSHKCTVDQHTVDTCLRRLTFFSSEINHFPTTGKELDKYCKYVSLSS